MCKALWDTVVVTQESNGRLTALMGGVQRFVGLDEQEAVGAADGDGQVMVDLC